MHRSVRQQRRLHHWLALELFEERRMLTGDLFPLISPNHSLDAGSAWIARPEAGSQVVAYDPQSGLETFSQSSLGVELQHAEQAAHQAWSALPKRV